MKPTPADIVAAQIAALQWDCRNLNKLACGPGSHEERLQTLAKRVDSLDSAWRQHAKVSFERYQDTRALQTALMDANKQISDLWARMHQLDMKKVGVSEFTQLWKHEDGHKQAAAAAAATTTAEQWVLSFGNPSDGFEYVGPFATATDAIDYAEKWIRNQEWWTILLQAPAKEEGER
jgi:hypothetical protein